MSTLTPNRNSTQKNIDEIDESHFVTTGRDDCNGIRMFNELRFTEENERKLFGRRVCQTCGLENGIDVKLLACAGCRYAIMKDRKCQRADWQRHKPECQMSQTLFQDQPLPATIANLDVEKMWFSVFGANEIAFNWVASQAFKMNPQHDPRRTVLVISLGSLTIPSIGLKIPMFPVRFRFRHNPRSPGPAPNFYGSYIFRDKREPGNMPCFIVQPRTFEMDIPDYPIPEWPFTLAQAIEPCFLRYGKIRLRLLVLLQFVYALREPGRSLDSERFRAPRMGMDESWDIDVEVYLAWRDIILKRFDKPGVESLLADFNGISETWKNVSRHKKGDPVD